MNKLTELFESKKQELNLYEKTQALYESLISIGMTKVDNRKCNTIHELEFIMTGTNLFFKVEITIHHTLNIRLDYYEDGRSEEWVNNNDDSFAEHIIKDQSVDNLIDCVIEVFKHLLKHLQTY